MIDRNPSPRVFLARFAAIWSTGLIPAAAMAWDFTADNHPLSKLAWGTFAGLAILGVVLARASLRSLYPTLRGKA